MSDTAICVENLSKNYRIGKLSNGKDGQGNLSRLIKSPFSYLASTLSHASADEILWALKDVSFEVNHGEVVGIIGRNGAGKSTLLKILSRITEPTSGRAWVNGRVGSLLEVGTGFHPELTGRENIYLSGAILGMKREEIDRKFDDIVEFAETEKFLNTPVKRYSSGMYVRLAFAVAAHLEPEILLVDEVLAVGDAAFQKKCLGKMGDVATHGRTILFVSHNMIAIQNLCERTIWLNDGIIEAEGPSEVVIPKYLSKSFAASTEQIWEDAEAAPGNSKVRLRRVCVRPENGSPNDPLTMESPFRVEVDFCNLVPDANLHITLHFYNEQQVIAFSSGSIETDDLTREGKLPVGVFRSICHLPENLLNSGKYRVALLVLENTNRVTYRIDDALAFDVIETEKRPGTWYGKEPGVVRPKLPWTTEWVGEE